MRSLGGDTYFRIISNPPLFSNISELLAFVKNYNLVFIGTD